MYTQKDIARMLRGLGRTGDALETIRPIYETLEVKQQPDGWIDEEMAECLLATGRAEEARSLFGRAYETLRKDRWVIRNDPAKLERLKKMARGSA